MLFAGDAIVDDELKKYYVKYFKYIELFFISIDRDNGSFLHLPYCGGVMEQPYRTMQVMLFLQNLWLEKIVEEQERWRR